MAPMLAVERGRDIVCLFLSRHPISLNPDVMPMPVEIDLPGVLRR